MRIESKSVFGSTKTDALVFLLPVVLVFVYAGVLRTLVSGAPPSWYYPSLIVFFDMPHLLCGYWVMLNAGGHLRPRLLALAVGVVGFYYWLLLNQYSDFLFVFVAHLSVWHFIKQHQAWFYLASPRPLNRTQAHVNRIGLWSATWGFFALSLCGDERFGWDRMNDVVLMPASWGLPIAIIVGLGHLLYFLYYLRLILLTGKSDLSQHLIWLSAVLVWGGARVISGSYLAAALIIIPHSVSYFFLLYRYAVNRGKKKWVSPAVALLLVYFVGCGYQVIEYLYLLERQSLEDFSPLLALALGLGSIHFLHDKVFWNAKDNPEWKLALTN